MNNAERQMLAQFVANVQQLINVAEELKIDAKFLQMTWETAITKLSGEIENPKS